MERVNRAVSNKLQVSRLRKSLALNAARSDGRARV